MQTHQLVVYGDHICALGNGGYFSWIIEYDCGEWELATIYGKRQGTFKSFSDILKKIEYQGDSMGENNQYPVFDIGRHNRPPTLSEYATAKKQIEGAQPDCGNPKCKECYKKLVVGVDPASDEGDKTVVLVIDRETLLDIYWNTIPVDQKRKIKIENQHQDK